MDTVKIKRLYRLKKLLDDIIWLRTIAPDYYHENTS